MVLSSAATLATHARALRRRLEQLDWVPGRILEKNLFPAGAGHDVVPERDARLPPVGDLGFEIIDFNSLGLDRAYVGIVRSVGARGTATRRLVGLALVTLAAACRSGTPGTPVSAVRPQGDTSITPAEQARSDLEHPRYTAAGVQFMSEMIGHHAQAIVIADWAPSHEASAAVRALCERISVSQADEIKFMEGWLRDRHQAIPPADPRGYAMPGMDNPTLMPGMLTAAQMMDLDQARGARFDRLLLTDMITHHRGAIDMVRHLAASGQEEDDALAMYAANVEADQSAEIGRMKRMLAALPPDTNTTQHHAGVDAPTGNAGAAPPGTETPLSPTQPPARP